MVRPLDRKVKRATWSPVDADSWSDVAAGDGVSASAVKCDGNQNSRRHRGASAVDAELRVEPQINA